MLGRRHLISAALFYGLSAGISNAPAAGQSIPSPYRFVDTKMEAGLFAGHNFIVGEGAFGIGPQPGPAIGGRWGISIGGPFSIEANVTYLDTKRDVKNPGLDGEFTTVGESDVQLMTIDARIKFMLLGQRTWRRLSPHALVGAGFTFDWAGEQAADLLVLPVDRYKFGTSFSGILGFGARWFLGDRFLIRPDLTLQLWQQDIPDGYSAREALVAAPREEWIQAWGLMIGLSYNF